MLQSETGMVPPTFYDDVRECARTGRAFPLDNLNNVDAIIRRRVCSFEIVAAIDHIFETVPA